MFTGLVQELGTVSAMEAGRLEVETPLGAELAEGDSVAVNGVCLTATSASPTGFTADVMEETLRRTSESRLRPGSRVNLELALRASDRLGGHFVQGHVDGMVTIREVREEGTSRLVTVDADAGVLRYIVEKGSVALDGVSLTVAAVDDDGFTVALIPETLERTTFGAARAGVDLNLEVDVLAKYVERLMGATVR